VSAISSIMTMRATLKRNASGADVYGEKKTDGWVMVADAVPCYLWIKASKEVLEGKSVVVEDIRAYFRHDADIKRGDRIVILEDRRGRSIMDGTLEVDVLTPKKVGDCPSHYEARLRRANGC